MSDDLFDKHFDANDMQEHQDRKDVMFEIESKSLETKKAAQELLFGMYKRHFLVLFSASVVAAVVLFAGFFLVGTILWGSVSNPIKTAAIAGGALCFPAGNMIVIVILERYLFSRDTWTLERMGYRGIDARQAKGILIASAIPVIYLVLSFLDPATAVFQDIFNPLYILVLVSLPILAIFEEMLFRGIYWKYIDMKYSRESIFVLSALIFAIIHVPAYFFYYINALLSGFLYNGLLTLGISLVVVFFNGVILAFLRHAKQDLVLPTAFHVVYNLITGIVMIQPLLLLLASAILAAIMFVLFMFTPQQAVPAGKAPEVTARLLVETREYKNFKLAFLIANATMIMYYVIMMTGVELISLVFGSIATSAGLGILIWILMSRGKVTPSTRDRT
nr:type II CAAX endopeptidase family protein [Candidatus Sigynarchaeota archaeon]